MFLLIAPVVLILFIIFVLDCDFVLKFKERFGDKPEDKLRGKVVWITGASSGIGEHLAYELAKCECKLVLSARRKEELERVKEGCLAFAKAKSLSVDVMVLPLDVTDHDNHKNHTQAVINHFHKIDILVNNSGRSQRSLVLDTPNIDVDQAMMDINVIGPISLTKAVVPHMIKQKSGQIVVTSSVAGKVGSPGQATYSATKFAIQGYFDALRMEVNEHNIGVTLVCPGPVQTDVVANAFTEDVNKPFKEKATVRQDSKRMPPARCAQLMSIAIANRMNEVWISPNPVLLFVYVSQYCPVLYDWLATRIGMKQVRKMREETESRKED